MNKLEIITVFAALVPAFVALAPVLLSRIKRAFKVRDNDERFILVRNTLKGSWLQKKVAGTHLRKYDFFHRHY